MQNSTNSATFRGHNAAQWGKISITLYLQGRTAESIYARNIARRLQPSGTPMETRRESKTGEGPITYEELKLISKGAQEVGGREEIPAASTSTDVNPGEMQLISQAAKQRAESKKSNVPQSIENATPLIQNEVVSRPPVNPPTPEVTLQKIEEKVLQNGVAEKQAVKIPPAPVKQMKLCPLCMHELPLNAKFCNHCGNRIS